MLLKLLTIPFLLFIPKLVKPKEDEKKKDVPLKITYFMYKDEKRVFSLSKNTYNLKGDRFIIGQDTYLNLPKEITKGRERYKSKNIKEFLLLNSKEKFVEKWFPENVNQIKYFSITQTHNFIFIIFDLKNFHGSVKNTVIQRIQFNATDFIDRKKIDDISSKNCTKSIYISSQNVLVHMCTDGYRILLRRNLLKTNVVEDSVVSNLNKKNTEKVLNFTFIVMPTNSPEVIQYLVFEVNTDEIMHVISTKYVTKQMNKIECKYKVKEMFYVGNMILLIKTHDDQLFFKEVLFGTFNELEKWKFLTSYGTLVNSYFSISEKSLIIEILSVTRKDRIEGDKKIQDFDIIAFKYDKNTKTFALFRRWTLQRGENLLNKIQESTFLKISRTNTLGFIVTMVKEELLLKENEDSYPVKTIYNTSVISTDDYSFNYKPHQDNSWDSFADDIVDIPSSEAYISFFRRPFKVDNGKGGYKHCMLKLDLLQKPKVVAGWDIAQFDQKTHLGVLNPNVSFWAMETDGKPIIGAFNYTIVFNDTWQGKQDFIWEEEEIFNKVYTIFTGVSNRLDMMNYVRGSFVARVPLDKDGKVLATLKGEELHTEPDFKKIEKLMTLTFFSSLNSRMKFFYKSKAHTIDTLFGIGVIGYDHKRTNFIVRKYADEKYASLFLFKPMEKSQKYLTKLKEQGSVLKVVQYDERKFIFLRKGGRVFLFDTQERNEMELNFPGKPCMDIFLIQHPKIKLNLLCMEDDLKLSLYYAEVIVGGWTSKSTVSIAIHQRFKNTGTLNYEKVKAMVSKEFSELVYIFAKNQPKGKPNLFIYEITVGITTDVIVLKEIELVPKQRKTTRLFNYDIIDAVIVGKYFVMLLNEGDGSVWLSVKLIKGGNIFEDTKLVQLDRNLKISDESRMVIIDNEHKGIMSQHDMNPMVAFKVRVAKGENVVIFDPESTILESVPFMLLPNDEEQGIVTFPFYTSTIDLNSRSIGVVRYQPPHVYKINNLVHIFSPAWPSVQIKGTLVLDFDNIFEPVNQKNKSEKLAFVNYLSRYKNHDKKIVVKNITYNYVEGYTGFGILEGGKLSNNLSIKKTIDLRGFTNAITGEVDKHKYTFNYKILDIIKGNILSTGFETESLLEKISGMIKFFPPVKLESQINLIKVENFFLKQIEDFEVEPIEYPKELKFMSLDYVCINGRVKNFSRGFTYECNDYAISFNSHERMVLCLSKKFKVLENNPFKEKIFGIPDKFVKKVDLIESGKLVLHMNQFKKCANLIVFRQYVIGVCEKFGSMRIHAINNVDYEVYSRDLRDEITGKINQIRVRLEREYILITSFSVSNQRYVKLWIYQIEEIKLEKSRSTEVFPKLKFHFIRSFALNSVSYKAIIHRVFKEKRTEDKIYIFSVDCYSGRLCLLKRDAFLTKNYTEYKKYKVGRYLKSIEFKLSDKYEEQNVLTVSPRITSIYDSDIYFFYIYIHFSAGSDFIFKISTEDIKFSLEKTIVYKISNPFFGVTPLEFKTPVCYHWCCVTVSTYTKKTFLKFYEIEKDQLNNPVYKIFPIAQIKNPNKRTKNNIGTLTPELAFYTISVLNITGFVEKITFNPRNDASSDVLTCLVLKRDGTVMNITVSRKLGIEINNLYLSSTQVNIFVKGMKNKTLTIKYNLLPYSEPNKWKYFLHLLTIILISFLAGYFAFNFLNKYENDAKEIQGKKFNIRKRVNEFFNQKKKDGTEDMILISTKAALKTQQDKGVFTDLEKKEDEIFEEIKAFAEKYMENLKKEVKEDEKRRQADRDEYMKRYRSTWKMKKGAHMLMSLRIQSRKNKILEVEEESDSDSSSSSDVKLKAVTVDSNSDDDIQADDSISDNEILADAIYDDDSDETSSD